MALPKPSPAPNPVILQVEPFGGSIRLHNPSLPHVYWDDAAVTRGEGAFETLLIHRGRACNLQRHLERFQSSAEQLGLPIPDPSVWRKASHEAIAGFYAQLPGVGLKNRSSGGVKPVEGSADSLPQAAMTWTLTGGRHSLGVPSAWITVRGLSATQLQQRAHGVAVMTAERGFTFSPTLSADRPWVSLAAKSLNYTAAMAALRQGRTRGFDDVLWVEGDRVLEGATSTLVVVKDKKRLRTPPAKGDILAGTSVAALFSLAEDRGWRCKETELSVDDLMHAQSVWLVSSARLGARITRLDDRDLPVPAPKDEAEVADLITSALTGP